MRRFLQNSLIALGVVLLAGCATVVKMNVKHAPDIDLGATQSLALDRFAVSGKVSMDATDGQNILKSMVGNAILSGIAAPSDSSIQEAHYHGLVEALIRNGYYKVGGAVTDAKLGGQVSYNVNDRISSSEMKNSDTGKVSKTYTLTRTTSATVSFQVADKNGQILGAAQVSNSTEKQWQGNSEEEVRGSARSTDISSVVLEAVAGTQDKLVQKIAPHFVLEERELEKGKGDLVKKGNEAAEKGDWRKASQIWTDALASGETADRTAVTYNLAIFDESEGRLEEALKKFEKLLSESGDSKYAKDVARMRSRINEEQRMNSAAAKRAKAAQ